MPSSAPKPPKASAPKPSPKARAAPATKPTGTKPSPKARAAPATFAAASPATHAGATWQEKRPPAANKKPTARQRQQVGELCSTSKGAAAASSSSASPSSTDDAGNAARLDSLLDSLLELENFAVLCEFISKLSVGARETLLLKNIEALPWGVLCDTTRNAIFVDTKDEERERETRIAALLGERKVGPFFWQGGHRWGGGVLDPWELVTR